MTTSSRGESIAALLDERPAATVGLSAGEDQELELKLDLDPSDIDRLAGSAIFADGVEQNQESTYYDTMTDTLRRSGLSLRVRRTGQRYVQTVKAAGIAAAGIFAR